jgi:hypothetical protein
MADTPTCRVCGMRDSIIVYPDEHALAICPSCCEVAEHPDGETGHRFFYEPGEREHYCNYCGIPRNYTEYQWD